MRRAAVDDAAMTGRCSRRSVMHANEVLVRLGRRATPLCPTAVRAVAPARRTVTPFSSDLRMALKSPPNSSPRQGDRSGTGSSSSRRPQVVPGQGDRRPGALLLGRTSRRRVSLKQAGGPQPGHGQPRDDLAVGLAQRPVRTSPSAADSSWDAGRPGQSTHGRQPDCGHSPDSRSRRAIAHIGVHGGFMNTKQITPKKSVSRRFAVSAALALALAAVPATATTAAAAAHAPQAAAKAAAQSSPTDGHGHGDDGMRGCLLVLLCS